MSFTNKRYCFIVTAIMAIVVCYAIASFTEFGKYEYVLNYDLAFDDMPENVEVGEESVDVRLNVYFQKHKNIDFCKELKNLTRNAQISMDSYKDGYYT